MHPFNMHPYHPEVDVDLKVNVNPEVEAFLSANPHVFAKLDSLIPENQTLSSLQTEGDLSFGDNEFVYSQSPLYGSNQDFTSTLGVGNMSLVGCAYRNIKSPVTRMLVDAGQAPSNEPSSYSSRCEYSLETQCLSSPTSFESLLSNVSIHTKSVSDFEVPSSKNSPISGYNTNNNPDLFEESRELYTSNNESFSFYYNSPSQDNISSPFSPAASAIVPSVDYNLSSCIIPHHPPDDQQGKNLPNAIFTHKEQIKRKKRTKHNSEKLFSSLQTGISSPFSTYSSPNSQDSFYSNSKNLVADNLLSESFSTYNTFTSPGTVNSTNADYRPNTDLITYNSLSPYNLGSQYISSPLRDDTSLTCDFEAQCSTFTSRNSNSRSKSTNLYTESSKFNSSNFEIGCSSYCGSSSHDNKPSQISPITLSTAASSVVDHDISNIIPRNPRGDKRRKNISHSELTQEEQCNRKKLINNDASKRYRQRQTYSVQQNQQEEPSLLVRQAELKSKFEDLKRQKEEMILSLNDIGVYYDNHNQ